MKTLKILALGLAAVVLASTLAIAQEDDQRGGRSRHGRRGPQSQNENGDHEHGGRRGGNRPPRGGGFLFSYMKDNEEYKQAFEAYQKSQEAIHEEMKTLRETTREKLQNATTDEEREKVIADAKEASKELLTKLVTGMIEHRKTISEMLDKDKDEIVAAAIAKIYERPNRRDGADGADGQGGPRDQGGPRGQRGQGRGPRRGGGQDQGDGEE